MSGGADLVAADLEDEFLATCRALVGLAVRSVSTAPVDVTLPQYRVLSLLAFHGPMSIGSLARAAGFVDSSATRLCDRLERAGLVKRERNRDDARVVDVRLTTAGADVVSAVTESRRTQIREVVEAMSGSDQVRALEAIRTFNASAAALEWPAPDTW